MKIDLTTVRKFKPLAFTIKILPWAGWLVIISTVIFSGNFLYKYFYKTITEAQDIYIIRSKVSLQAVDVNLYEAILNAVERKRLFNDNSLTQIKDPFSSQVIPTPKPETTTPPKR